LYVLLVWVPSSVSVQVGALGTIDFAAGYYAYCGSARRNLSDRLTRHMARHKKCRWHIDYLTCCDQVGVDSVRIVELDSMSECELNASVQTMPGAKAIRGFGSSDCTCVSHLTYLGSSPSDLCSHRTLFHD
jgi:Uri superfamily endonuclease